MRRFVNAGSLLTLCLIFIVSSLFGSNRPAKKQVNGKTLSTVYSFSDEQQTLSVSGNDDNYLPEVSYRKSPTSQSPGVVVGYTWYDYQHSARMGRMIDWGPYYGTAPDGMGSVFFSWMWLPSPAFTSRKYAYNGYKSTDGLFYGEKLLTDDNHYGGYVQLDVSAEALPIVGGHEQPNSTGFTMAKAYRDNPNVFDGTYNTRVPDSVAAYGNLNGTGNVEMIWPTFAYQYGTDTILHVFAQEYSPGAGDPQSIVYFRCRQPMWSGGWITTEAAWDYPPYVVDTVFDISQTVVADRNSDRVALAWTANIVLPGDCDTCSDDSNSSQWNNDLYYQVSFDQGLTWQPRVNLTKNVDGVDGFRPYAELSVMFDNQSNLHILWPATIWPANTNDRRFKPVRSFPLV